MPGRRVCFWFGKTIRTVNEPVLGSTVTSGKFQDPFNRIGCAVFKKQLHPCLVRTGALDPAGRYVLFEFQQIGTGLRYVNIDGIGC